MMRWALILALLTVRHSMTLAQEPCTVSQHGEPATPPFDSYNSNQGPHSNPTHEARIMAKRGRPKKAAPAEANGETTSGYFKRVFKENPQLLGVKSNEELFRRWLADHPDHAEVPGNVKGILFNIKSGLRKKRRRKRGRPKKVEPAATLAVAVTQPKPVKVAVKGLEALEEQIDDALTLAKHMDREGLDGVIRMLRRARNTVVCKLGE